MMSASEVHDIFLRLYTRAVADGERVGRLTRLHRMLERLGAPEDAIEIAYLDGIASRECRVNGPDAVA